MKKGYKKLFFGMFLAVMIFSLTISVKALTIVETTDSNDSFDNIEDGTVVIGITKFEPDVVITARRASKAIYNDALFYYDEKRPPRDVEIHYLLMGKVV